MLIVAYLRQNFAQVWRFHTRRTFLFFRRLKEKYQKNRSISIAVQKNWLEAYFTQVGSSPVPA